MVHLRILSGRCSGTICHVERFPCTFGRGPEADLRLEDPGIWDQHFRIDFGRHTGFKLSVLKDAWALINGRAVECAILKSGDIIEAGSAKLQFSLAPATQSPLNLRERVTWVAFALLCLGEIGLIYRLLF